MRYDISMGIGEPKTNIDFAALKARLKASIDQSVDKAQSSPPVSPASEPKSPKPDTPRTRDRGNRKDGSFKANELEDLKKKGDLYISTMENVLTQTKSVKGLMVLVDRVPSKGAKKRLSLKLSNGLQVLLPVDKDFSSKFNTLIDQWEKRIVEVLFDDAHREYFRDSLRETLKTKPEIAKGDFFSQYLEHFDCSALGDVVPVREKLVALWEEQCPATGHKLKNQKRQEEKFIVGEEYVLRSDPSKEYVITEISGDKIAYKSLEGGLVSYSTKEQFARFLKKKFPKREKKPNKSRIVLDTNRSTTDQASGFLGKTLPGDHPSLPGTTATSENLGEEIVKNGETDEHKRGIDAETILKNIEATLDQQPQSVQDMFRNQNQEAGRIPFQFVREIQGKQYIFTTISGNEIALVQNDKDKNKYKLRFFRFSGSDHQWKAIPGSRGDGGFMKGAENNPLHHYVQSGKLHKDIYRVLNELPQGDLPFSLLEYLPVPEDKARHVSGKYADEFEFKEEYLALKNKNWKDFQDFAQQFYKMYIKVVASADSFRNFTLQGKFYRLLSDEKNIHPALKVIKEYLEQINADSECANKLSKISLAGLQFSEDDKLRKLSEIFHKNFSEYIEEGFEAPFPKSMLPDFSVGNRRDSYEKPDVEVAGDTIHIEEYAVENSEGDSLVFAMAYDSKGRVYIDNIYDPRVGMSDYGTLEKICQMGHLVYKPEDYKFQAGPGFPERYLGEKNGHYVEINKLWEKLAPVKKFKEELIRRGVLKTPGEDLSRVGSSATIAKEKKPKERAYEELIESIAKAEKKQYASVISEGLAPFVGYVKMSPTITLRSLIEHENYGGIEKVAQALSPILQNILPRSWSESERQQFALEFTIQEIKDSF